MKIENLKFHDERGDMEFNISLQEKDAYIDALKLGKEILNNWKKINE